MSSRRGYLRPSTVRTFRDSAYKIRLLCSAPMTNTDQADSQLFARDDPNRALMWNAIQDAGRTIWAAFNDGLLSVPAIGECIGREVAAGASPEWLKDHSWSNFFARVMRHFVYPHGHLRLPLASEGLNLDRWLKHELELQARGCDILADIVENPDGTQFLNDASLRSAIKNLNKSAELFIAYDAKNKPVSRGNAEEMLIVGLWSLRAWFDGLLPEHVNAIYTEFVNSTSPRTSDHARAVRVLKKLPTELDKLQYRNDPTVTTDKSLNPTTSGDSASQSTEWLTITKTAKLIDQNKGVIDRLVQQELLRDNGKTHRERRIDPASLLSYAQSKGISIDFEDRE